MGNRAVIATKNKDLEVYLHWNGGWDSVQCFLEYCRLKGYRKPEDDDYGWARLCQVIGNYFVDLPGETEFRPQGEDEGLSVGIGRYGYMDADLCDNGRYVMEGWRIAKWVNGKGRPVPVGQAQLKYDPLKMLLDIDSHQPLPLGERFIRENMADWLIQPGDHKALAAWLKDGAKEVKGW